MRHRAARAEVISRPRWGAGGLALAGTIGEHGDVAHLRTDRPTAHLVDRLRVLRFSNPFGLVPGQGARSRCTASPSVNGVTLIENGRRGSSDRNGELGILPGERRPYV